MAHRLLVLLFLSVTFAVQNFDTRPTKVWEKTGASTDARFGTFVDLADTNGDGNGDVIVTAYMDDVGGTNSGSLYVYRGSGSAIPTSHSYRRTGSSNNQYGYHMDAGAFDGDSTDDVMVGFGYSSAAHRVEGTTATSYSGSSGTGASFAYGSFDGSGTDIAIGNARSGHVRVYNNGGSSSYTLTPSSMSDTSWQGTQTFYGHAVAAGKFRDSFSDLVVCGPADGTLQNQNGRCVLYKGRSSSMSSTIAWSYTPQTIVSGSNTGAGGGHFGWSAVAMDIDKDGKDDLIVGAPHGDSGRVYIFKGSSSGLPSSPTQVLNEGIPSDGFGYSLSVAGDLDKDTYPDLLIGAPFGGTNGEGRVYAFRSAGGVGSLPLNPEYFWLMDNPSSTAKGYFGYSVGGGEDINDDGWMDVVVGAPLLNKAYAFESPRLADLSLSLSSSVGSSFENRPPMTWVYTLTVTNAGPESATSVKITCTKDVSSTINSISGTGGFACSSATGICTVATLGVGVSRVITVTMGVAPDYAGDLLFLAEGEHSRVDPGAGNNRVENLVTVVSNTVLSVTWTAAESSVDIGGSQTWTGVITNTGNTYANDVVATYPFPAGLAFISTTGGCGQIPVSLTCSLGSIANGASKTITMEGKITTGITTSTLSSTLTTVSSSASTVTRTVNTAVTVNADMSVTITASPNPVPGDGVISYAISVINRGDSDAVDVVLTSELDEGLTLKAASTVINANAGGYPMLPDTVCSHVVHSVTKKTLITCTFKDERPGFESTIFPATGVATVTIFAQVAASGVPYSNRAIVSSGTPDTPTANNDVTVTNSANVNADMSISMVAEANPGVSGDGVVRYQIQVANIGPSECLTVQIVATMDAALNLHTFGTEDGLYIRLSSATGSCGRLGRVITCDIPSMRSGQVERIDILAAVGSSASVTSDVTVAGLTVDPNSANNAATTTVNPTVSTDVSITKSALGNPVAADDGLINWIIEVTSAGPSIARDVVITDNFPDGVYLDSWTLAVSGGAGVGCNGSTPTGSGFDPTTACSIVLDGGSPENQIVCNIPTMEVGVAKLSVESHILVNAGGSYPNTATATSTVDDPNLANNVDSDTAIATIFSDMQVVASGLSIGKEMLVSNHFSFSNAGPATARAVTAQITLPDNADLAAGVDLLWGGVDGTCSRVDRVIDCTITDSMDQTRPPYNRIFFSVDVQFHGRVTDYSLATPSVNYTSVASVAATSPDKPAGDLASVTVVAFAEADVAISSRALIPVIEEDYASFSIFVSNLGPVGAVGTTFTATLPEGMVLYEAVGIAVESSEGTTATSGFTGTGNAGDPVIITVDFTSIMASGGQSRVRFASQTLVDVPTFQVVASVTSGTPDPALANNDLVLDVTVIKRVNMLAGVVPSTLRPVPKREYGQPLSLTLQALNKGPNNARDVVAFMLVEYDFPLSILTLDPVYDPADGTVTCDLSKDEPSGFVRVACVKSGELPMGFQISARLIVDLETDMLDAFNVSACTNSSIIDVNYEDNCKLQGVTIYPVLNTDADLAINTDFEVVPIAGAGLCGGWSDGAIARMGFVASNKGPQPASNTVIVGTMDANIQYNLVTITRDGGVVDPGDVCEIGVCTALPALNPDRTAIEGAIRASGGDPSLEIPEADWVQVHDSAPPGSSCPLSCTLGSDLAKGATVTLLIEGVVYDLAITPEPFTWRFMVNSSSPDPERLNNDNAKTTCIVVQNYTVEETGATEVPPPVETVVPAKGKGVTFFLMIFIPLLILLILLCVAWKAGFFKRKRPPKDGEEEVDLDNAANVFGDADK